MTKKLEELRGLGAQELSEKLVGLKTELAKERSLAVSGTKSEKPSKIRNLKRTIARIYTIINEKELRTIKQGKRPLGASTIEPKAKIVLGVNENRIRFTNVRPKAELAQPKAVRGVNGRNRSTQGLSGEVS